MEGQSSMARKGVWDDANGAPVRTLSMSASIEIGEVSHLGVRSATLPTGQAFVSQARLLHLLHFFANLVRHKIFG